MDRGRIELSAASMQPKMAAGFPENVQPVMWFEARARASDMAGNNAYL